MHFNTCLLILNDWTTDRTRYEQIKTCYRQTQATTSGKQMYYLSQYIISLCLFDKLEELILQSLTDVQRAKLVDWCRKLNSLHLYFNWLGYVRLPISINQFF